MDQAKSQRAQGASPAGRLPATDRSGPRATLTRVCRRAGKTRRRSAARRGGDQPSGPRGRNGGARHSELGGQHDHDDRGHVADHGRSKSGRNRHRKREARISAAEITIDAMPNKTFKGHVIEIGNTAILRSTGVAASQSAVSSQEAKDFKVVIALDNPPDEIRPGSVVHRPRSPPRRARTCVTIPMQALTVRQRGDLEPAGEEGRAGRDSARSGRREEAQGRAARRVRRSRAKKRSSGKLRPASRAPPTSKLPRVSNRTRRSSPAATR